MPRGDIKMDLFEKVKKELSKKRYEHCLGVANLARELALKLGEDGEKAYTAGMLHDIAKELSSDTMFELCEKYGIIPDDVEKKNPGLLHGPVGAEILRENGVRDTDILNAVRYHTVGRAEMSTLEKIIYLADMVEPSRTYPEAVRLRQLARSDFDEAFLRCLMYTTEYNMKKYRLIHVSTIEAWNSELMRRDKY